MNKLLTFIILAVTISLNSSCVNKTANNTAAQQSAAFTDSLKFTSGIRAILQDSKGNYWLGSHKEGLCRFNGESFTYYTTANGLPDQQVRSIKEDKNGTIWIGTANGVCSFNGSTFATHSPNTMSGLVNEPTGEGLWFNAGNKPGAFKSDGQSLQYVEFPIPASKTKGASYGVTSIASSGKGAAWIATYSALFHFNGENFQVYDDTILAPKEDDLVHIRSVFEDSKGRVWIGNNGIGVLLIEEGNIIKFSEENGLVHKNSNKNGSRSHEGTLEHVFVINEDADGNMWFGDRDTGIWKYDGTNFTNYKVNEGFESQMAWCIYVNYDQQLLFGMAEGGVYKFIGDSFERVF